MEWGWGVTLRVQGDRGSTGGRQSTYVKLVCGVYHEQPTCLVILIFFL